MKNTPKVLSVVAGLLQLMSLLAYFVIILLQKVFKGSGSMGAEIFSFPIAQTLYMLLATAAVLLIVAGAFISGRSSWPHILGIVVFIVFCPIISRFGPVLETNFLISPKGAEAIVSHSIVQSYSGFAIFFSNLATPLALVAAGMSIAAKKQLPQA